MSDESNGYEAIAREFQRARSPHVGRATLLDWARELPPGAEVLDLGCGDGVPLSKALVEAGFVVYGVDASPTLVAAFREHLPNAEVECSAVEQSSFFGRRFDAVVAWGLVFLLRPPAQRELLGRVARALKPGGRLLFTAPREAASWEDALTGLTSTSLGKDAYREELTRCGLVLKCTTEDEGQNFTYFARKR